jgi:NTP pyrophosphatase (non-canonical NTP hydrolase)
MGSLRVIVTSPRIPAGLLSAAAWDAIRSASVVVAVSAEDSLARAVAAAGIDAVVEPDATVDALLDRADADADVAWLWGDRDTDAVGRALADRVVGRAEGGVEGDDASRRSDVEVEVVVGSYDPVGARLLDLVEVMDRLRRECPWDREQTHESLVRYLVEETYETIEAIESGDRRHLQEELGDLLLQVMFHARVASEDSDDPFTIDDVAGGIVEKLVRRHPHVFGDAEAADAAAVEANWDSIKAAEKGRASAVDGIPAGLPALAWADKVVGRVAKSSSALSVPVPDEPAYTAEALGEVLFALVAAASAAGIDPEQALRERVRLELGAVRRHEAEGAQLAEAPDREPTARG